jgi:hypothetical protein
VPDNFMHTLPVPQAGAAAVAGERLVPARLAKAVAAVP